MRGDINAWRVHRTPLWWSAGGRFPCLKKAVHPGFTLEDTESTSWLKTPNMLPRRRWSSSWLRQSPVSNYKPLRLLHASRCIQKMKITFMYSADRAWWTRRHCICEKVCWQKQAAGPRPCSVSITWEQGGICRGAKSKYCISILSFKPPLHIRYHHWSMPFCLQTAFTWREARGKSPNPHRTNGKTASTQDL